VKTSKHQQLSPTNHKSSFQSRARHFMAWNRTVFQSALESGNRGIRSEICTTHVPEIGARKMESIYGAIFMSMCRGLKRWDMSLNCCLSDCLVVRMWSLKCLSWQMMRTFLTALWWQSWWQSRFWCQAAYTAAWVLCWNWTEKKFLKYQKMVARQTYKTASYSMSNTALDLLCGPIEGPHKALLLVRLSICSSVSPMPTISWKSESRRNFIFGGDITLETSNWESKLKVKRSTKVKITQIQRWQVSLVHIISCIIIFYWK